MKTHHSTVAVIAAILPYSSVLSHDGHVGTSTPPDELSVDAQRFDQLPLRFEPNLGQAGDYGALRYDSTCLFHLLNMMHLHHL